MSTDYEEDAAAWALEQVALLRAGRWSELDIEHIAEEIEDMNLSHWHQLASRMSLLIAHLLKWQYQPARRGASWESTIRTQRVRITRMLSRMPSLRHLLDDADWRAEVWQDGCNQAAVEAHLPQVPAIPSWTVEQLLDPGFWPRP